MVKNFIIALLLIIALGCKKNSTEDITLYKWKRDLYRALVQKEEPAVFYSSDPKIARNPNAIFLSSDNVVLTEYRKDIQQDSIYKASGGTRVYKYEKLENVSN
jgi:hypothetical protein